MTIRPKPDQAALEIAHSNLNTGKTFNAAMQDKALCLVITAVARTHMRRRERFDIKKMRANDND